MNEEVKGKFTCFPQKISSCLVRAESYPLDCVVRPAKCGKKAARYVRTFMKQTDLPALVLEKLLGSNLYLIAIRNAEYIYLRISVVEYSML